MTRLCATGLLLLLMMGCNTPSDGFRGIEPVRVTVGPSTFDIRRRDADVELIRVSPEAVFTLRALAPRAIEAARIATGCRLIPQSLVGEATLMFGVLECDAEG